jgi:tetraacyldisaccharide 4'-kinase
MSDSREQRALRVLSGEDRSIGATLLRGALTIAEPFYAAAMISRNAFYDACDFASVTLPRPTISVGNLTTGGTGKTPIVQMLASELANRGLRPAILMRGYRAASTGGSDEQRMLSDSLGGRAIVIADANRVAGAVAAMRHVPPPDVFLLDDAFQHRRATRDFDLVLIDAAEPFGFGHVLPRGLLREPIRGVKRADAIVVTRASHGQIFDELFLQIRRFNKHAPIHLADHVHTALITRTGEERPIDELKTRRFFAFAGIANPDALQRQFRDHGATFAEFRAFRDHHGYTSNDVRELNAAAKAAGAEFLVTTEKDWVKIAPLATPDDGLPIVRVKLSLKFRDGGAEELIEQVLSRVRAPAPPGHSEVRAAGTSAPPAPR